jgi:hypothetical protein
MTVQHTQRGRSHPTLSFSTTNMCGTALNRSSMFDSQAVSTLSPPVWFLFLNVFNNTLSTAQIIQVEHKGNLRFQNYAEN